MANKKYIANGRIFEAKAERKIIVGGAILETRVATAAPSGFQVAWAKQANQIIKVTL
jgi:hypothetical protein